MTTNDPRADWAESLDDLGPDAKIYDETHRGALLDLLDGDPAIGGEAEVTRRLRGRPSLTPNAKPGHRSRQLHVRLDGRTEVLFNSYEEQTKENASQIVRQALIEFFEKRHVDA